MRNVLALLREQLWIIPALISVVGVAFALALLGHGPIMLDSAGNIWWLFGGDAETARTLLSALLSGTMTMTSLVVSVTFVTLALASNQLGPRFISNFIADRQIQLVLGLFLGTTLHIVVVMRSRYGTPGSERVPGLAVTVGSAFNALCLFALVFYVHKVARSIVTDRVVERISNELRAGIAELPERGRETDERPGSDSLDAAVLPPHRTSHAPGCTG